MAKSKRASLISLILAAGLLMLTGCGNGGPSEQTNGSGTAGAKAESGNKSTAAQNFSTDPVTLSILASKTELNFDTMLIEPVKKKYPFITLNIIQKGKGNSVQELITSGQLPDLITDWTGGLTDKKQFGIFFDITPLLKSHNVDLNRFQPNVVEAMRTSADNNEIYGLPFNSQLF